MHIYCGGFYPVHIGTAKGVEVPFYAFAHGNVQLSAYLVNNLLDNYLDL